jgi:hypothetical protein
LSFESLEFALGLFGIEDGVEVSLEGLHRVTNLLINTFHLHEDGLTLFGVSLSEGKHKESLLIGSQFLILLNIEVLLKVLGISKEEVIDETLLNLIGDEWFNNSLKELLISEVGKHIELMARILIILPQLLIRTKSIPIGKETPQLSVI